MPLTNDQFQILMNQYELTRQRNRQISDEQIQKIYAELPELSSLDSKIASLSVEQGKKLLDGDETALESLRQELGKLSASRLQLLSEHGYSLQQLEPIYTCLDCRDTGYIGSRKCHCLIQASIDLLYTQSNIHQILQNENFDTFDLSFFSKVKTDSLTGLNSYDTMVRASKTAHDFVNHFSTEYNNLLIYGNTGVGKTFLSNCIAKDLLEQSYSVLYFSSGQLFDALAAATFSKDSNPDSFAVEDMYTCDLLIIDDLGTEMTNSFISSQLFLCLNERNLRRKSTIISTNLSLEKLRDTYSERIFSRISSNYTLIKLFGDDIRLRKKLQNMEVLTNGARTKS